MTDFTREVSLKDGRKALLRAVEPQDAARLIQVLQQQICETRFLARSPGEFTLTEEQERAYLEGQRSDPMTFWIVAEVEGRIVGMCSTTGQSSLRRFAHRTELGISILQEACGLGLGGHMMAACIQWHREQGFEQLELSVVEDNFPAIRLYEKMGFEAAGRIPRGMKYEDGSYRDLVFMWKDLTKAE